MNTIDTDLLFGTVFAYRKIYGFGDPELLIKESFKFGTVFAYRKIYGFGDPELLIKESFKFGTVFAVRKEKIINIFKKIHYEYNFIKQKKPERGYFKCRSVY